MYNEYNNKYGYYCGYPRKSRENTIVDDELISLNSALDLIREEILEGENIELFWDNIISKSSNENTSDILSSIREDNIKHNEILRFIYSNITGEVMEKPNSKSSMGKITFQDALEKSFLDSIAKVKKYRKIMGAMPNPRMQTLIMAILTNKLRHATLINYLMNKENVNMTK